MTPEERTLFFYSYKKNNDYRGDMITAFKNAKEYFKKGGNNFYCGQKRKRKYFKLLAGTFEIDTKTYFVMVEITRNSLSHPNISINNYKTELEMLQDYVRNGLEIVDPGFSL